MIDNISRVSSRLVKFKPLSYLVALGACLLFGYVIFVEGRNSGYLIASVLALLWSLATVCLVSTFPHVPSKPSKELRFFRRVKVRLVRFVFHIAAWVFVGLSLTIVWVSWRLASVWHSNV